METTLAGQVADEMKEYGIEVLGIHVSETRWKGTGSVTLQSGGNDEVQQGGVAIMISARSNGRQVAKGPFSKILLKVQKTDDRTSICTNN